MKSGYFNTIGGESESKGCQEIPMGISKAEVNVLEIIKNSMTTYLQDAIDSNNDSVEISAFVAAVNEDDCNGNDIYDDDDMANIYKAIACKDIAEKLGYKVNLEAQSAFTLHISK